MCIVSRAVHGLVSEHLRGYGVVDKRRWLGVGVGDGDGDG